jgi:hypothetical protein
MKRDFTQATQDRLKSLVREADTKWCSATDWLGDQVLGAASALGITHWFTDADGYQKRVFDMNNTSEHELQEIFNQVYETDAEYGAKFKSHTEQLRALDERIRSTAALVCTKSAYQSTTEQVTDLAISNYIYVNEMQGPTEPGWAEYEGAFDATTLGAEAFASSRVWYDAKKGKLGCDGSVRARSYLERLTAHGSFRIGDVVFDAGGKAFIGSEAVAKGKYRLGLNGIMLAGTTRAFAGAKANGSSHITFGEGILSGRTSATGSAIVGAEVGSRGAYQLGPDGFSLAGDIRTFLGARVGGALDARFGEGLLSARTGVAGSAIVGTEAGSKGEFRLGPNGFAMEGDAGAFAGMRADASTYAALGEGLLSAGIGAAGSVKAGAWANVNMGAYAEREERRIGANAGFDVFAGVEASVTPTASLGPTKLACEVSVSEGIGASAMFDVGLNEGVFRAEIDLSFALNAGVGIKPSIEVDLGSIIRGAYDFWN